MWVSSEIHKEINPTLVMLGHHDPTNLIIALAPSISIFVTQNPNDNFSLTLLDEFQPITKFWFSMQNGMF